MTTAPRIFPGDDAIAPFGHRCALHAPLAMAGAADEPCDAADHGQPGHRCDARAPRGIVRRYALIDELLDARRSLFGAGVQAEAVFAGYRAHAYHLLNFARQWLPASPERDDKLAVAAVFHDLGAWPEGNLDYLRPSADLAQTYLEESGRDAWKPEMRLMIEMHHKITPYRGVHAEWVEPIRRADWCDISFATMRFGLPKSFVDEVRAEFPLAPFYPGHVYKLSFQWLLRHPLNPVPILRW